MKNKNAKKITKAAAATALALTAAGCGYRDISQNETGIKTVNGVITQDNVGRGRHWIAPTVNNVDYPKVSHTLHTVSITAVDKGQQCEKDCVTLQTRDQQTVTGSLVTQYHVDRNGGANGESVAAELYRVRGAANQTDIEEKLLVPPILDCMISEVNHRDAKDLVDDDRAVVNNIRKCVEPRVAPYHIKIDDMYNRGFGPSPEARASMRKLSDAKQDGQVADTQLRTAEIRDKAAARNAEIQATAYNTLVAKGVPKDQVPTLMCLGDTNSTQRPCIPNTANGGGIAVATPR